MSELRQRGFTKVVIVGGEGAVSSNVANQMQGAGFSVERVGGNDRYETAAMVATQYFPSNPARVVVATGMDFLDATVALAWSGAEEVGEAGQRF